jgi:hypothetical protein
MKRILLLIFPLISFLAWGQDEITIDGSPCGIHGSSKNGSKEYDQNALKNRFNFPGTSDFDASLTLAKFVDGTAVKGKFSESKAVEITGYVYDVKVGGVETCNCKTKDPSFRDTHIEITLNDKDTGPENRVIAEVTPRIRQMMLQKGIDWTTEALKQNLKGHMVRIQGWLFYDGSHETENFADDPKDEIGRANWRATCWEIHPITFIEVIGDDTATELDQAGTEDKENLIAPVPLPPGSDKSTNNTKTKAMESTPLNTLIIILLGAILGMVGQGIRVVVGIKKVGDEAVKTGQDQKDLIQTKQLALSLFIAFAIGAIAGVLAAVTSTELSFSKTTIIAFIAAGYAGTDFIEGFIRKYPAVTKDYSGNN